MQSISRVCRLGNLKCICNFLHKNLNSVSLTFDLLSGPGASAVLASQGDRRELLEEVVHENLREIAFIELRVAVKG